MMITLADAESTAGQPFPGLFAAGELVGGLFSTITPAKPG